MKNVSLTLLDHINGHIVPLFNNVFKNIYKIKFFLFLHQNRIMFSSIKTKSEDF